MTNKNKLQPARLDAVLEGYLEYLADVGRKSPRTVIDVRCTLKKISEAMDEAAPGVPLWKLELTDFLGWLQEQRAQDRSPASLNKQLSHMRGLLEYAWRSGRSDRNVLDGFRLQDAESRQEPRSLSLQEAERLVRHCSASTPVQRRDRIAVLLLYGCGLRTFELCGLRLGDINVERKELTVRAGKGIGNA